MSEGVFLNPCGKLTRRGIRTSDTRLVLHVKLNSELGGELAAN